jgi:hypothetical protein
VRRLSYQAGATTYTETVRSKADLRDMDGQLVHLHSDYRTVNFSIYFEKVSFFIVVGGCHHAVPPSGHAAAVSSVHLHSDYRTMSPY